MWKGSFVRIPQQRPRHEDTYYYFFRQNAAFLGGIFRIFEYKRAIKGKTRKRKEFQKNLLHRRPPSKPGSRSHFARSLAMLDRSSLSWKLGIVSFLGVCASQRTKEFLLPSVPSEASPSVSSIDLQPKKKIKEKRRVR